MVLAVLQTLALRFLSQYHFVGFITGPQSFPQPLVSHEEQKYVEACRKGDENARNILIEHNLRLVAHVARKYTISNTDSDDLISIGTIGLIKAVSSYDPTKGIRLATYAARCIENAMLTSYTQFTPLRILLKKIIVLIFRRAFDEYMYLVIPVLIPYNKHFFDYLSEELTFFLIG